MKATSHLYQKLPAKKIVFAVFFLLIAVVSAYLANQLVDFAHLCLIFGPAKVLDDNLHFVNKHPLGPTNKILKISNGSRLTERQSLLNFIASSVAWILMLCCLFVMVHTIMKKLIGNRYKQFYKSINADD